MERTDERGKSERAALSEREADQAKKSPNLREDGTVSVSEAEQPKQNPNLREDGKCTGQRGLSCREGKIW